MGDVVAWSGLTLPAAELTYFSFWLSRSAPVAVKTLSFWGSDGFFTIRGDGPLAARQDFRVAYGLGQRH